MQTSDEVLETERLVLRRLTMDDVDALMGIFSDPEAMRFYPSTRDREGVEDWVRWVQKSYEENGFGLWACILKDGDSFAGQCGIMPQEVEGKVEPEIGWLFLRKYWGRGLASEAARASRDYGFEHLGLDRIISLPAPENVRSCRVAENAGLSLEKEVFMERWGKKVCVYAIEKGSGRTALTG